MTFRRALIALALAAAIFAACSGDDDSDNDDNTGSDGPTIEDATPAATSAGPPTSVPAQPESSIVVPTAPPRPEGEGLSLEDATEMLGAILLTPADMPAAWVIQSDTSVDNAAAAAANPDQAASIERCGRLLSRTDHQLPAGLRRRVPCGQVAVVLLHRHGVLDGRWCRRLRGGKRRAGCGAVRRRRSIRPGVCESGRRHVSALRSTLRLATGRSPATSQAKSMLAACR